MLRVQGVRKAVAAYGRAASSSPYVCIHGREARAAVYASRAASKLRVD